MEFIKCLTKFEFVIGVLSLYSLLHHLHNITVKLQGRTKDKVQAYEDVEGLKSDVKSMKVDLDKVQPLLSGLSGLSVPALSFRIRMYR